MSKIEAGNLKTVSFGVASKDDLRGTLTYQWTAPAGTVIYSPNSASTSMRFTLHNPSSQLSYISKTVSLKITDVDGKEAVDTYTVSFKMLRDGDLPICDNKPNLPQCNP